MKKNIFVLLLMMMFTLMSTAAIAAETGKTKKWVKIEPVLVHEATDSAQIATPPTIPPTMWFNWWSSTGSYNVNFYGEDIEPTYRVIPFVDGIRKGRIIPQATFVNPNNPDPSSELLNPKQTNGQLVIYAPGMHHIEIRVYVDNQTYYSFTQNNLEVPYFDAGVSMISANSDTVYIRYYLQPIFITINAGESANITVGDFYQNTLPVQVGQWGEYFVEISVPLVDYQNNLQNQQIPTTIELQGYVREFSAYYWQPY